MATVFLLWTRQTAAVAVSAGGITDRIKKLAEVSKLPDSLHRNEVEENPNVGKMVHFRFRVSKLYFLGFTLARD